MKLFASQPALIAVSTLVLVASVRAQSAPSDQKKSAQPPQASAIQQPSSAPSEKQPASPSPSAGEKKQPVPPAQQQEPVTQAAAAAAQRQPLLSRSEPPVTTNRDLPGVIYAAPKGIEHRTARALDDGRKVRSNDDKYLGSVKDFLIDSPSGEVSYAVVSSGGIGREHLHLVPFKALKLGGKNEYTVPMDEAEWKKLGALDEKEFKAGHLTMADEDRRELAKRFERPQSGEVAASSAFYTQDLSSNLVRADEIRGSAVFLGETQLGTIRDVIIDEGAGTASALFEPSWHLTESKGKFVVPLNRYSFGTTKSDQVTTSITRADFEQMRKITHEAGAAPKAPAAMPAPPPRR